MVPMSTFLIVLLLLIAILAVASFALGRASHEVDSARDTEFLELEGAWVRYNVIGAGPPVLLVHGWLSSSRIWERLAHRLAQRYTVYTLDLKGFGESDKPLAGYGVRYGSRLLYAFCAHFGLTRTAVIAHDLGGDMAVKLAADHPDVVGRLVLVAVPADEDQIDFPTPLWLATLPAVGPLFYALGRAVRALRVMWLKPFVLDGSDLTDEAVEDAGRSSPAAMSKTLSVTRREISGGRLARQARIIKVPVLLLAGEDDQIVDPQSVSVWARTISQAEIRLMDECGHMPMIERPGEFNSQMLAFLTGDLRYLENTGEPQAVATEEPPEEGPSITDLGVGAASAQEPDDETAELIPPEDEAPSDDEPLDIPNILRKRADRIPPVDQTIRDEDPAPEPPEDDLPPPVEEDEVDGEPQSPVNEEEQDLMDRLERGPAARRRGRARNGDEDSVLPERGPMPEIPEDLFKWPDTWDEYRPRRENPDERTERERRRGNNSDDPSEPGV